MSVTSIWAAALFGAVMCCAQQSGPGAAAAEPFRQHSPPRWTMEKLASLRSSSLRADQLRSVVIEQKRVSGRLEVRHRVDALGLPGHLWRWIDRRPTKFGLQIDRYVASRASMEAPGFGSERRPYARKDSLSKAKFPGSDSRSPARGRFETATRMCVPALRRLS